MSLELVIAAASAIFFGLVSIFLSIKKDNRSEAAKTGEALKYSSIKEEFVHMIVHELRAPLTSIKDSSELLLSSKSSLNPEEQEQFLKIINRQSKTLLGQISSILDAAKFESGTFVLDKKNENIADIIHEQVKIFEPQAEKKKITISSHIEGPIPPLYVDCLRIDQAINNLLSNSIKFTPEGGRISVEAKVAGANVEISVSDSGVGIPQDLQDKIFSKFYQVKSADRHEEKDGSGLGLYIVKKIIDAHGGTIDLKSEAGRGTTMRFTLPLNAKKEEGKPLSAQFTVPN